MPATQIVLNVPASAGRRAPEILAILRRVSQTLDSLVAAEPHDWMSLVAALETARRDIDGLTDAEYEFACYLAGHLRGSG